MKKNFTLIELLVVIAIIAILAGLVMPALGHAQAKGRTTECINNKKQLITALRMYGNDHTSMIPYAITVDGEKRPYSWIIGGLGSGSYSKEMTSRKVMVCNTANKKDLDNTGENAVGIMDVEFGAASGWYKDNRKEVGRFVSQTSDKSATAYVLEKMKNPSGMMLLADSFAVNNGQKVPFWTFSPTGGTPNFNGMEGMNNSGDSRLAAVHVGGTTVAYADGRAESVSPAQLAGSAIKLKKYYDDNLGAKDL